MAREKKVKKEKNFEEQYKQDMVLYFISLVTGVLLLIIWLIQALGGGSALFPLIMGIILVIYGKRNRKKCFAKYQKDLAAVEGLDFAQSIIDEMDEFEKDPDAYNDKHGYDYLMSQKEDDDFDDEDDDFDDDDEDDDFDDDDDSEDSDEDDDEEDE